MLHKKLRKKGKKGAYCVKKIEKIVHENKTRNRKMKDKGNKLIVNIPSPFEAENKAQIVIKYKGVKGIRCGEWLIGLYIFCGKILSKAREDQ